MLIDGVEAMTDRAGVPRVSVCGLELPTGS
jgi:hypothetical protein